MMKKMIMVCLAAVFCVPLSGCESLGRKFVRQKKDRPRAEALLEPQDYATDTALHAEQYDQYYMFWKGWQDELVDALAGTNRKRQLDAADEALKNLLEMRSLLTEEARAGLDGCIARLQRLKESVASDAYSTRAAYQRAEAERIASQVRGRFSGKRVKDSLL